MAESNQGSEYTMTLSWLLPPNEFARDWLENRYSSLISDTLNDLTGSELDVKFIIPEAEHADEFTVPAAPNAKEKKKTIRRTCLKVCLTISILLIHLLSDLETVLPTLLRSP